jgi:hypothetical protein
MGKLSRRWIDYSGLDVLCLSLGQLDQLAQQHPAALRAVLDWTAAGGNLWVYGVGEDWQRVGELEDLVGLVPGAGHPSDPTQRGWSEPDKRLYGRKVLGNRTVIMSDAAPERPHFILRQYDLGLIVALAADDPFPGSKAEWNWVLGAVGADRWLWHRRHGLSMTQPNRDYWEFLVPGVGLAPVTEFCVLISLFVLAIGPLNYWLLRRWKRLHLLVVTIPLAAAAVTFALFGYAILADGLGTRVRVRSVTQLDQRRRHAVCWARLSYYSGLAPGRGLMFPEEVAVLPREELPANNFRNRPARRELIWENGQWLASGWLSSRTRTQYLTVRSRRSSLGLELIRPGGDAEKLQVKNRLRARIKQLLVCPAEGEYYWAAKVDPEATVTLERVRLANARLQLRKTYGEHPLGLPEGMEDQYYGGIFGMSRVRRIPFYYGLGGYDFAIGEPTQQTSRLEQALSKVGKPAGRGIPLLDPGSYVAVVEQSPEVALGVPSAREEASYHVILGRW